LGRCGPQKKLLLGVRCQQLSRDLDQPIVNASEFNAMNTPPWSLPV
jgi:uncharacterized protein involved in type VI secretion and phage assembly